jgi:hypothetical protein
VYDSSIGSSGSVHQRQRGEAAALGGGGDVDETGEQMSAVDAGVGERRDVQIEKPHADLLE